MRPDRLPHPQSLIKQIAGLGDETLDLQLMVLKSHLIAERQLYGLLSFRLNVEEHHLPQLNFYSLAKLALGGETYKSTLLEVLALNDLRNEYGHELGSVHIASRMKTLSERAGVFWPLDATDVPREVADRSVRVACGLCLGDIWTHVVEVAIEQRRYSTAEQQQVAERELASFKADQSHRRVDEGSIRELFCWFTQELKVFITNE